jgi:hypothetical protein|tara:strand:- start:73 stop:465 length:393 start_codon:yes stop_codon:yes gene_type:complete
MSYLSTFTNYIQEFITKLADFYPDDVDFSNFKTYMLILKKTNPRKIVEIFDKYCLKYRTEIEHKNENFLLTTDFTKDHIEIENVIDNNNAFDIMTKIKTYWEKMNVDMKENIWMYLNLFLRLSDKMSKNV